LIDAEVSAYVIEPSPITGILTGRPTARANVAHFMCELIEDEALWSKWKFGMPVIMNAMPDSERKTDSPSASTSRHAIEIEHDIGGGGRNCEPAQLAPTSPA
jgi:hypothetical protein